MCVLSCVGVGACVYVRVRDQKQMNESSARQASVVICVHVCGTMVRVCEREIERERKSMVCV